MLQPPHRSGPFCFDVRWIFGSIPGTLRRYIVCIRLCWQAFERTCSGDPHPHRNPLCSSFQDGVEVAQLGCAAHSPSSQHSNFLRVVHPQPSVVRRQILESAYFEARWPIAIQRLDVASPCSTNRIDGRSGGATFAGLVLHADAICGRACALDSRRRWHRCAACRPQKGLLDSFESSTRRLCETFR